MKTVAFVPIKLNNERLPGKNIKEFYDGTPLIKLVLNKLVKLLDDNTVDEVYVYCSDEAIIPYLPEGVKFLQRPAFLDEKTTKGRLIYEEFVKTVEADVYLLEHVTTPLVKVAHIKDCVDHVKSGEYESAFTAKKMQTFFWKGGEPLNFDLFNPPRTQDMEPFFIETTSTFVFTRDSFLRNHSRTSPNPYMCEVEEIEAIDIDYAEDFELADLVYKMKKEKGEEF
ncbi:MAG: CMP-N-acetylneuraminic acid synthetase [Pseudobutyrivibrio sp.]|nr:CMP-N-acetylneuraminic acid synthetase [Pseudobutyrivibrio sp.]